MLNREEKKITNSLFRTTAAFIMDRVSRTLTVTCITNRINQTKTAVNRSQKCGSKTSRTRDIFPLFLSLLADLALGWAIEEYLLQAVFSWINKHYEVSGLTELVYSCMGLTVLHLKSLLTWLMENPAGLKLNSVLSRALGNFFLYHIHLWVTYVYLVVPALVSWCSHLLPLLPWMGITTQLSLAGDLFTCLTVHVHCFHSYARRLCHSQFAGLVSLWRLFLGKKYNPLRDRVDSANSTVDQLLVGTIVFTVLLFLFPTSLVFYCVFLALQTAAAAVVTGVRWTVAALQFVPGL